MSNEMIRRHWNERSPGYRKQYHAHLDEEIDLMQSCFKEYLPEKTALKVLDIGTGLGIQAMTFAELGHQVTALDLSEEMLARAKQGAAARGLSIDFHHGDAENLPFADNSFDVVVNMHLLWTLTDHEKFFQECKRVLVPGGRIFAIDGHWFKPDDRETEECSAKIRQYLPLYNANTPEQIAGLVETAGFSEVSWKYLPEYADYMQRCDPNGRDYQTTPYLETGVKS